MCVDDLLVITGNDQSFVSSIITKLGNQFTSKDMGSHHFILGVKVISTSVGLFLSEHKYVCDLFENANMAGAKDVSTPLSTSQPLHLMDETVAFNGTQYWRVIGSLQYLSLSHLDISFAVNKLLQCMHKSIVTHWTATNCNIRSLNS